MALLTSRIDDLNGDVDAVTVVITVNGKGIEIDLAERSLTRLLKALEPFWSSGSERDYDVAMRQPPKHRTAKRRDEAVDPKAVRAWAAANGVEVNERGRVPADIIEQFRRSA
jgi:hypothetical protein